MYTGVYSIHKINNSATNTQHYHESHL